MLKHYPITPIAKPRMTRADAITMRKLAAGKRLSEKERKRAPLLSRWLAYKQEVEMRRVDVPESGAWIVFVLPMPGSWSRKRKREMCGQPHRGQKDKARKNDKDNLEKGLLDAVFGDDSAIWDSRVTKVWGERGAIFVGSASGWDFAMPFDAKGWELVAHQAANTVPRRHRSAPALNGAPRE